MSIGRSQEKLTSKIISVSFFILGLFILYVWDTHKTFECYQKDQMCQLHTERLIGPSSDHRFPVTEIQGASVQTRSLEQGYNYIVTLSTNQHSRLEIADFPNDSGMAEETKSRMEFFLQNAASVDLKIEEPRNLVYRFLGIGILMFSVLLFLFAAKISPE